MTDMNRELLKLDCVYCRDNAHVILLGCWILQATPQFKRIDMQLRVMSSTTNCAKISVTSLQTVNMALL